MLSKKSKNPNNRKYAIVDDSDYGWLNQLNWTYLKHPEGNESAFRKEWPSNKTIYMHRLIMNAPEGLEVDHINRNRLDNRRCNLRLATRSQNAFNKGLQSNNTSGYRGVYYFPYGMRTRRWLAKIKVNGRYKNIGFYETPAEAAAAYKKEAVKIFGDFARSSELA